MTEPSQSIRPETPPVSDASRNAGTPARGLIAALCALLAVINVWVYWPAKGFEFVQFDDPDYVSANQHVLRGLTLNGVGWAFRTGHASNWHPLTWLSHMLDAQLLGKGPGGPHLVNVLLHATNTVLLLLLLNQLTGAVWRSTFVAALFALHPLHVESVAWISERKDVLSAFFGLLALMCYGRFAKSQLRQSPFNVRAYSMALLFFALGLMSKPMLVTLPFVMLLLDFWPLGRLRDSQATVRTFRNLVLEKWPFFLLVVASGVITFLVQRAGQAMQTWEGLPLEARAANSLVAIAWYLGKTFWPTDLACLYPHPGNWPLTTVLLSSLLVVLFCVATVWFGKRRRFLFTGWFWFVGMLVPVIGVVQVGIQSWADRYTYLPSIGIFVIVVWSMAVLTCRWRAASIGASIFGVLVLVACGATTRHQLSYWQDSETLFTHAIAVTRGNYTAYNNLGLYQFNAGRIDEAIQNYRRALDANPNFAESLNNLGNAFSRLGDYPAAIGYFESALRLKPNHGDFHYDFGNTLLRAGRTDEAIEQYQQALRIKPDDAEALNNLGYALVLKGRVDEAIGDYRKALEIDPDYTEARANLAGALVLRKQFDEAITCYEAVLRTSPNHLEIHYNLANALTMAGRNDEAIGQYHYVLERQPTHAGARSNLGAALVAVGKLDEAVAQFDEALRINPTNARTHFRLASVLKQMDKTNEAVTHLREAVRLQPDFPEARRLLEELDKP